MNANENYQKAVEFHDRATEFVNSALKKIGTLLTQAEELSGSRPVRAKECENEIFKLLSQVDKTLADDLEAVEVIESFAPIKFPSGKPDEDRKRKVLEEVKQAREANAKSRETYTQAKVRLIEVGKGLQQAAHPVLSLYQAGGQEKKVSPTTLPPEEFEKLVAVMFSDANLSSEMQDPAAYLLNLMVYEIAKSLREMAVKAEFAGPQSASLNEAHLGELIKALNSVAGLTPKGRGESYLKALQSLDQMKPMAEELKLIQKTVVDIEKKAVNLHALPEIHTRLETLDKLPETLAALRSLEETHAAAIQQILPALLEIGKIAARAPGEGTQPAGEEAQSVPLYLPLLEPLQQEVAAFRQSVENAVVDKIGYFLSPLLVLDKINEPVVSSLDDINANLRGLAIQIQGVEKRLGTVDQSITRMADCYEANNRQMAQILEVLLEERQQRRQSAPLEVEAPLNARKRSVKKKPGRSASSAPPELNIIRGESV